MSSPARRAATWRGAWSSARATLGDEAAARRIVEEAAGVPLARLLGVLDEPLAPVAALAVAEMVARCQAGEPLQHVLGHWGFRGVELLVDARAFVPRPETEILVEVALGELARVRRPGSRRRVVDLGTGSGAVACALVLEAADVEVLATDRSASALSLARENVARLPPSAACRVRLAEGDWYAALPEELLGAVDLVVSNPPYLSRREWATLDPVVRDHDPPEALVAGPEGTEALEAVVRGASGWLVPGGAVAVELAPSQAHRVAAVAGACGLEAVHVHEDLAGRPRVLVARRPGAAR